MERSHLAAPFCDVAPDVLASDPQLGPQLVGNDGASLERLDVGNRDEGAGVCPSLSRGPAHAGCTADDQYGSGAKPVQIDVWLDGLHVRVVDYSAGLSRGESLGRSKAAEKNQLRHSLG